MKWFGFLFVNLFIFITFGEIATTYYIKKKYQDNWYDDPNFGKKFNATLESTDKFYFDERVQSILPQANQKLSFYKQEFYDLFTTAEIAGIGLFDDGINPKKRPAIMIGDSFTRGVGSLFNLQNGWVEKLEKASSQWDYIGMGFEGTSQVEQRFVYNQVKDVIPHEVVFVNFFSGGDFIDNLVDWLPLAQYLSQIKYPKPSEILKQILIKKNYQISHDFLANSPVKSKLIFTVLRIYEKCFGYFPPFGDLKKSQQIADEVLVGYYLAKDSIIPSNVKEIYRQLKIVHKIIQDRNLEVLFDEKLTQLGPNEYRDQVIENTALLINLFYEDVTRNGKKFYLIIHPGKHEVYSQFLNSNEHQMELPTMELVKKINSKIKVINILPKLQKLAKQSSENFYYKVDGHYNVLGYEKVFQIIKEEISTLN